MSSPRLQMPAYTLSTLARKSGWSRSRESDWTMTTSRRCLGPRSLASSNISAFRDSAPPPSRNSVVVALSKTSTNCGPGPISPSTASPPAIKPSSNQMTRTRWGLRALALTGHSVKTTPVCRVSPPAHQLAWAGKIVRQLHQFPCHESCMPQGRSRHGPGQIDTPF